MRTGYRITVQMNELWYLTQYTRTWEDKMVKWEEPGLAVSQNKHEPMGWGGLREWHRHIYTTLYTIASGKMLCSTGSSAQCSVMT